MHPQTDTSPAPLLAHLNEAQRQAVEFGIGAGAENSQRALLVIAGAGSGKTNTLVHRVAHLIAHGADAERILLLTFSRRAADDMIRRVTRIVAQAAGRSGRAAPVLPWAGTFHGVGARLLRDYASRIGLAPDFSIHDREDSADLMNLVRHELGFSAKNRRFPLKGSCLAIYSAVVNTQAELAAVLQSTFPWCAEWEADLRHLFRGYVAAKQAQQVLDYDDLLLYWAQLATEPALAQELAERFSHILVDEYQDTNRLQATILLGLSPDGRGLTVVGDDAQAIYSFRGATVRNILDFPGQFATPAHRLTLDRNYRSTQAILEAANAVIALASERFTKNLWTERVSSQRPRLVAVRDEADQAHYVAEQVLARREQGVKLRAQAVRPDANEALRAVPAGAWPAAFDLACQWYLAQIERLHEDGHIRRGDVEQLAHIAATYPSRERFLTELTLDPPDATSDQSGIPLRDEDYLILSTIHSAKGQEWTAVTLLNAVDGCLPSDLATGSAQQIEEERRLLYVAMTRAKDQLDILTPQRFYVTQQAGLGDRYVYGSRTRFITNALLPRFEQVSWPAPAAGTGGTPQSRQIAVDLAARMRTMW